MNYTQHIQLPQWVESDRIMMDDFNDMAAKIDEGIAAVAEDVEETAEAISWRKVLDLTLEAETQKWNIDMSGIDLSQYQKLVIYPHLKGNTNQWTEIHINELTTGYHGTGTNTSHCGTVPMVNDPQRQNFGFCEYILLYELPQLYMVQAGVTGDTSTVMPGTWSYRCPRLADGATHLQTLNFWFAGNDCRLLPGSAVQIYGLRK